MSWDRPIWFLAIHAALLVGCDRWSRSRLSGGSGTGRAIATITLSWAWATVGVLVLGSIGWLNRPGLLGWSALALIPPPRIWREGAASSLAPTRPDEPALPPWSWDACLSLALVLWASALLGLRSLVQPVKVMSDGPIYHLWFAARWWKSGRLDLVAAPFGESVVTYFPAAGDVWFAWLMTAWDGPLWAKVGQTPFLVLCGLATYDSARRLGLGPSASLIGVAWFLTCSPFLVFNFEPNVDTIFAAGYLVACWAFTRYALGEVNRSTLAMGAIAAGLTWATKPSGLVFVPPLLVLAGILVAWKARPVGRLISQLAILGLVPLLFVGYWYGRNAWMTGNPLYPVEMRLLGGRIMLPGWHGRDVMSQSSYYIDPAHWRALVDILLQVLDPRLAPVWVAALCGAWALGPRVAGRSGRGIAAFAFLALLNVAIYWVAIPYRTQQRFLFHAVGLAAVPLAALFDRKRALQLLGAALLAFHVLTPQPWPWGGFGPQADRQIPWDFTSDIPNNLPGPVVLPLSPGDWAAVAELATSALGSPRLWPRTLELLAPIGMGPLAFLAAWSWNRLRERPSRTTLITALFSTAKLLLLGAAMLFPWGRPPAEHFYPPFRDYYTGWLALERSSGPAGSRVAYAGTNLPYYLMGHGLRNEVRYVNIDAHPDWLLHNYHDRASGEGRPTWPDPRPGWDRERPDPDAWLANLGAERIDLLVVARHNPGETWPIERVWADERPERFTLIYGQDDPLFRLYRLKR